jgi:hypothetical protein
LKAAFRGIEYPGEILLADAWRPTFAELTERFPSLEEGDIDTAAAEFTELLRKAFAKAKREHPGKRVRLSFKE